MCPEVVLAPISTSLLSCSSLTQTWDGLASGPPSLVCPSTLISNSALFQGRLAVLLPKSPTHPHSTRETIPGRPRVMAPQIGGRAKIRSAGS